MRGPAAVRRLRPRARGAHQPRADGQHAREQPRIAARCDAPSEVPPGLGPLAKGPVPGARVRDPHPHGVASRVRDPGPHGVASHVRDPGPHVVAFHTEITALGATDRYAISGVRRAWFPAPASGPPRYGIAPPIRRSWRA